MSRKIILSIDSLQSGISLLKKGPAEKTSIYVLADHATSFSLESCLHLLELKDALSEIVVNDTNTTKNQLELLPYQNKEELIFLTGFVFANNNNTFATDNFYVSENILKVLPKFVIDTYHCQTILTDTTGQPKKTRTRKPKTDSKTTQAKTEQSKVESAIPTDQPAGKKGAIKKRASETKIQSATAPVITTEEKVSPVNAKHTYTKKTIEKFISRSGIQLDELDYLPVTETSLYEELLHLLRASDSETIFEEKLRDEDVLDIIDTEYVLAKIKPKFLSLRGISMES